MVRDGAGPGPLRIAVSDDLPARHLLRLQERLDGATFELASPILGRLRIVKDDDEIALLTEAAHAADRVVAQIAGRPAGGADRGGCGPRGPRATHRRGARRGAFRDRRVRARTRPRPTTRPRSG